MLKAHDRFGERVNGVVQFDRHRAAHICEVLEPRQGFEIPVQPNLQIAPHILDALEAGKSRNGQVLYLERPADPLHAIEWREVRERRRIAGRRLEHETVADDLAVYVRSTRVVAYDHRRPAAR